MRRRRSRPWRPRAKAASAAAPYDDGAGGGGLNLGSHVNDLAATCERNRALLRSQTPSEPAWLSQVHGAAVVDAANATGMR